MKHIKLTMKLKPILPSLREKKRYMAFEVISESKIDFLSIQSSIKASLKDYAGTLGSAEAGILFFKDKYNDETQKGIFKINNKHVDTMRAAFALITSINNKKVIVRNVGVSGIMKKAYNNYIAS